MVVDVDSLAMTDVDSAVYRIISTRYPQADLFERVASPEHWDLLYAVEALTNQRLRDEVGDIRLVAEEDRVYGPGSSWIMAAFTHPPKPGQGGRFNRDFGVYYCALDEATAVAETAYHRARFLRESRIDRLSFEMRVIRAHLGPSVVADIRGIDDDDIYHPSDYSESQIFGARLRGRNSPGVYYRSVRHPTGECFAAMRPVVLSNAVHRSYLKYTFEVDAVVRVEPIAE